MAQTGRPPKPVELKRRIGNPGGRPLPKAITRIAPATVEIIDPPTSGMGLIEALLDGPAAAWIAQPDRLGLLELVRSAWDERASLQSAVADLPDGWESGRYTPAALIRLERVERNLTTWFSLLGLSPVDRSRLGVAEVKARTKLEALRDRRASRGRAG
jgi:hypothetical protein